MLFRSEGFDQLNQILVAFPETEVGAVLELKTKLTVTEIPFQDYFSTSWIPGTGEWTEQSKIRIHSARPLVFAMHGPKGLVRVKLSDGDHTLEAALERAAASNPAVSAARPCVWSSRAPWLPCH